MASGETYDKLDGTVATGDKLELLENNFDDKLTNQKSDTSSEPSPHEEHSALKKPKKVLEAGKAALADQSRGLRIIIICAFIFSLIVTIALILSIYLGPPQIGANAAVAAGNKQCSDMGLQMLQNGGNAVDAAVAAMLCMGVVNPESSGLGGGGFMIVHDHKMDSSEVFDFRETAPSLVKTDPYKKDPTRLKWGALAVGIPGELRGMEAAHKKYGKLSWKYVVSPAADLARKGFPLSPHTVLALNGPTLNKAVFKKSSKLKELFMQTNGSMKKAGTWITRPALAATLDKIAADGADVFYKGSVADDIVKTVANEDVPGFISKEDLVNYQVVSRDVVTTTYHEYTIESVPAPGSGPVLLSIMNYLEGIQMKKNNMSYHHMLEAFKFGYAQKELLGDPKFNEVLVANASAIMMSKEEALRLRNMTTNQTMDADFYGKVFGLPADKGTAHISVIDTAELIVSVTTTINERFGSMVMTDSGIILNNEMADFNTPGVGSALNEIVPGKRPLSSMAPTVVYETGHRCGLRMVCGGVNGSRIITGVAQVLLNNLTYGMQLPQAIDAPRIHNQLYEPGAKVVEAEVGFSPAILAGLAKMGHDIQTVSKELNYVNAVLKNKDDIQAVSDKRRPGAAPATFQ